ncbi:MAG: Ig-like domain-containing protein [Muribaculaceae bacterium]|nr:Ig-like domain-containing protein [Muribaculaceae bacterium]
MKRLRRLLLSAVVAALPAWMPAQTLYTCGDSTMADYATDGSTPTRGWGQYFGSFFSPDITVVNRGKGGMDVQGFYTNTAYWPAIKKALKPGDYVLLQFAHNDEKNGGMDGQQLYDYYVAKGDQAAAAAVDKRGSIPHDTYVQTLRTLVEEIRTKQATPLFASSICRMYFSNGDIRRNGRHDLGDSFSVLTANGPVAGNKVGADDHSMDYRWQMERLAAELDVPFLDMTESTRQLFVRYGDAKCHEILSDGDGSTHLSVAGAALIARQCAEMMSGQGILADKINVSDAGLSISPASGDLGEAYVGNVLTKEFTITGFGLSPESGEVTVAASAGFELSTDKSRWADNVRVSYDGGTLIGTFYVRADLKAPGKVEGTLTASALNSTISVPVSATGAAIPGSGAVALSWPLSADSGHILDGEAEVAAMNLAGLESRGFDGGMNLLPSGGSWPEGDIDESPTRYVEFGIKAPQGKAIQINRLALKVGGFSTDAMQCHVSYSKEPGFGSPKTFFSPSAMADGVMNSVETTDLIHLGEGETLLLRVYPWTKSGVADAVIRVSDVEIEGFVQNASTDVSMVWTLDKGASNASAADTSSGAFSFTSYSVGPDLTVTGTSKPLDRTGTMYQPAVNNQSGYSDAASVAFMIRPKNGITFQPKKVSFYATRNGTDGGRLACNLEVGGAVTELGKDLVAVRNNDEANGKQSFFEFDVNGVVVYNNTMTLRIGIYSLGNTKTMTIHDVVVVGEVSGQEVAVPVYTITAVPSIPEAGTVTVTPDAGSVEENVQVTVSATENFGYRFKGWTSGGKTVSVDNPYTFPATADIALVADYDRLTVYPLELAVEGGANNYMVSVAPEGYEIDGVRYYEAGTDVVLSAASNRILTFTNWDDNTTAPERKVRMDGPVSVTASYSADDYIVGWDFHYDEPASERAADFKAESDNAGLMSLHNENGETSSWLSRGVVRGEENGRYGARVWKPRTSRLFFEASFSTKGYNDIKLASSLSCTYMTYSRFFVQYSVDGRNYTDLGEMAPGNRVWTDAEFDLPAEAEDRDRVYVRWYPDFDAALIGSDTENDGLVITDVFVLGAPSAADDNEAPRLTASIPADNAEGASVNGSVVLTFDEKIVAGSGSATLDGSSLTPTISGKSAVFRYTGLDYNSTYTFSMPAGTVTDRSGNPAPAVSLTFTTMERAQPDARLYDAVVDINGSGDYTSLQAAVDAAPAGRVKPWLIFVMNGSYKEHIDIPSTKPFIHIIGQDRDKTVVLDDRLCGGDNALHVSVGATVVVNSNDCFFENITLENSYGHELQQGPQALALNTSGDRTVFNNVAMLSYQDTWITPSKSAYRAYVKNSLIEGAVDFIYNSGDIYIENTTLLINRQSGGYIVAPSHDKDVAWGYVFRDCVITAPGVPSKTSVWLGRPWHNYPKTVFLNTRAEVTIPATGWYETMGGLPAIWADWNTTDADGNLLDLSQRRDTYYRMENGEKVYGTAKNRLTDEDAAEYTLANVLSGSDSWQPAIKTEACAAPAPVLSGSVLSWEAVPYAICYVVTDGDAVVEITTETAVAVSGTKAANDYAVQAVNEFGGLSAKGRPGFSGIGEATGDESEIVAVYDLQGRPLSRPARGVNIVCRRHTASGAVSVEKLVVR